MRRLAAVFAFALILAACDARPAPNGESVTTPDPSVPAFTILWAGDTLLADGAQPLLDANGYDWPFALLAGELKADFTLINLEGPITTDGAPWDPGQRWSYNAQPSAALALAAAGVDAVSLANNHALDRGPPGIDATRDTLSMVGIAVFGAGLDGEAKQPLLIETPHGIVAVVGFGPDKGFGRAASTHRPGWLLPSATAVARGIALARAAGARWVIAFVHWGENYALIDENQRRAALRFADAGYDLVIGHGPHLAQPIALIPTDSGDGMPVIYSLGNFVFGTPGRYGTGAPGVSLLLRTIIDDAGIHAELRCLLTDNREIAFQPRLCPSTQARSVLRAVHAGIELEEDVGILRWGSLR